jgi:hypothetical protein
MSAATRQQLQLLALMALVHCCGNSAHSTQAVAPCALHGTESSETRLTARAAGYAQLEVDQLLPTLHCRRRCC